MRDLPDGVIRSMIRPHAELARLVQHQAQQTSTMLHETPKENELLRVFLGQWVRQVISKAMEGSLVCEITTEFPASDTTVPDRITEFFKDSGFVAHSFGRKYPHPQLTVHSFLLSFK